MNIFEKMGANINMNAKVSELKPLGWGILGGVSYVLVPTAIQGIFKIDMSGFKMPVVGAASSILMGMAFDKMEMAMGGAAAAATHLMYVKANDQLASLFNTPIPAFDKAAAAPATIADDSVPPGYIETTLPTGEKVLSAVNQSRVNDFMAQPDPAPMAQLPSKSTAINDYMTSLASYGLNDDNFASMVDSGNFN